MPRGPVKGFGGQKQAPTPGPGFNNRFTMPMDGIPKTTPYASVRNVVDNVKKIPEGISKIGQSISGALTTKKAGVAGKMGRVIRGHR